MTDAQITNMEEYYAKRYGVPENDKDAIEKLYNIYADLFKDTPNSDIKEGIAEYYRILINRDLPAYTWLLEALHITSKKSTDKRNFSYIVGMLRTWMKHGFGYIPNQEEEEIVEYFEQVTGHEVTPKSRKLLQNLMGRFGCVKVTIMINKLKNNEDMSLLFMLKLRELCEENLEEKQGEIAQHGLRSIGGYRG